MELFEKIRQERIVAILRGFEQEQALACAQALYSGGIRCVEITFMQHTGQQGFMQTARTIEALRSRFGDEMEIGAGTVMTPQQVQLARDAGAKYIISPNTDRQVIEKTKQLGLLSMPGAMTPTEAVCAFDCGADIVKIFPAGDLGPGYIKALMGPLGYIPFAAVGGMHAANFVDYLQAGAICAGVGGALGDLQKARTGDYDAITRAARQFTGAVAALQPVKL